MTQNVSLDKNIDLCRNWLNIRQQLRYLRPSDPTGQGKVNTSPNAIECGNELVFVMIATQDSDHRAEQAVKSSAVCSRACWPTFPGVLYSIIFPA